MKQQKHRDWLQNQYLLRFAFRKLKKDFGLLLCDLLIKMNYVCKNCLIRKMLHVFRHDGK